MLRELGVRDAPRRLLERSGARSARCRARISAAASAAPSLSASRRSRLRWPTTSWRARAPVDALVTADPGCLMHLGGRAGKTGGGLRIVHLATALARGVA